MADFVNLRQRTTNPPAIWPPYHKMQSFVACYLLHHNSFCNTVPTLITGCRSAHATSRSAPHDSLVQILPCWVKLERSHTHCPPETLHVTCRFIGEISPVLCCMYESHRYNTQVCSKVRLWVVGRGGVLMAFQGRMASRD